MQGIEWRWRDWVLLTAVGLLLQAGWALLLREPSYMDAYYYATNGQRLAAGHGFSELVIWQFLDGARSLPTPSHTYWMPLPSILAAAGYLLGDSFRAAQLPFWLLSGTLPLLTVLIGRQLGLPRVQLWTAAGLTLAAGFYGRFLNQPSTFAPFAWSGAGALFFLVWARTEEGRGRYWFVAGICAGLAHLTRADGVLLLLVGGWVWLIDAWRDALVYKRLRAPWLISLGALIGGYLLMMGGWFWRNWQLFGRPLLTTGTQTIFLTTYDDLFAYGRSFTAADLFADGWGAALQLRGEGLLFAVQNLLLVNGAIVLTPFVVWAAVTAVCAGRGRRLAPFFWYGAALYGSMSLLFTLPGMRGGLFHSSIALWPWTAVLAAGGIAQVVRAVAGKLPHWQPERSIPIFSALFVFTIFLFGAALAVQRTVGPDEGAVYAEIGAVLPTDAVVMAGNAPGFHYHTGLPAVSVPNEPLPVVRTAAAEIGVTHLLLDVNSPQPLRALYEENIVPAGLRLLESPEGYRLFVVEEGGRE